MIRDFGCIPKSAFTSENFERYRKESEREIREIERGEFLEKQAHKMRQITVAAVTIPKSIHGELLIRLHSEIQELSEKDFQESARMAYVDMFTGPFRLQETPGAKRFFSTYRANRHLELAEIVKIISDAGCDMEALSIADTEEFGILRLIVDNYEKAYNALKENNVVAAVPSSVPEQKSAEQTHHTVINNTTTIDINPVISEKPVVTPKNELTKNTIETTSKKVAEKPVVKQVAKKEVSKPVSKPKKVTSTKATTSTTTTAKVTKTPAKPKVVQYWVQVTSLKSKKSAENAREVLDENKITADIFTYKDKKDQLFYRVRVGPYTTKSEAEYWQSRVALIEKFSGAKTYITDSSAKKQ